MVLTVLLMFSKVNYSDLLIYFLKNLMTWSNPLSQITASTVVWPK